MVIPPNHPSHYVRQHAADIMACSGGAYGVALRRMWPRVFPGLPSAVGFGFASNGTQFEDTAAPARAWKAAQGSLAMSRSPMPAHAPYSEVGRFGVPAGPWCVEAPNRLYASPACPASGVQNVWYELHDAPIVRSLLGRSATMTRLGWYESADQIAVGLAQLQQIEAVLRVMIPASLRPQEDSLWRAGLLCAGWSAGPVGLATHLALWLARLPDLATVPESRRWWYWGEAMAAWRLTHRGADAAFQGTAYGNSAHLWTRGTQKLQTAWEVARRTGGPVVFFSGGAPSPARLAHIESVLGLAAMGRSPLDAGPVPTSPTALSPVLIP